MKKRRITMEIHGHLYEMVNNPVEGGICTDCDLADWCWETGAEDAPCSDFTSDMNWHFKKINKEGGNQ